MATSTNSDQIDESKIDGIVADSHVFGDIVAVLTNEHMAERDEARVRGSIAYDLALYETGNLDGEALISATFTSGPECTPNADARAALWSIAGDALSARTVAAPRDSFDIRDDDVADAVGRFADEYGHGNAEDVIRAYSVCVEARDAFDAVGIDPSDVYHALD